MIKILIFIIFYYSSSVDLCSTNKIDFNGNDQKFNEALFKNCTHLKRLKINNIKFDFDLNLNYLIDLKYLEIFDTNLKEIPDVRYSNLTILKLPRNNLLNLKSYSFLPNTLELVNFSHNKINHIYKYFFDKFINLSYVDLSENNLIEIAELVLNSNHLGLLNLSRNSIKILDKITFIQSENELNLTLDLNENSLENFSLINNRTIRIKELIIGNQQKENLFHLANKSLFKRNGSNFLIIDNLVIDFKFFKTTEITDNLICLINSAVGDVSKITLNGKINSSIIYELNRTSSMFKCRNFTNFSVIKINSFFTKLNIVYKPLDSGILEEEKEDEPNIILNIILVIALFLFFICYFLIIKKRNQILKNEFKNIFGL
ncbi:unnamed protein product [Brachionus calyciflorus]|uniref:Uncharacterized protein n=1 Tax=Brachionus calyciflorus TaxID=104777 RepID=A0A813RTR7_9BILA|nr:unnamed protein product [Brachionus calyciflorus]